MSEALNKRERDTLGRMSTALDSIDRLLVRLGLQGLQRMTATSVTELQALEQTAHNAALVNVERQLNLLQTYVQRYLDKDPLFNMGQYAGTINRLWLLNLAARRSFEQGQAPSAMIDVLGEARRSYTTVERPLMLQPLGASGWVSDTDFVGVTIYFFVDGMPGTIYQASNAKPTAYFGTDPRGLLRQSISDYVTFSIHDMAHSAFEFRNAKVSRDGRLSLHKDLYVKKAPYIGARAYGALACRTWIELSERLKAAEANPISGGGVTYVFIAPASLGDLSIDEKGARAHGEVFDARGAQLTLEVALRKENNFLIDNLELLFGAPTNVPEKGTARGPKASAPRPDAFFGTAWISGGQLKFFPYTAIYNQAVILNDHGKQRVNEIHLSLESLKDVRADEDRGGDEDKGPVRKRKKV